VLALANVMDFFSNERARLRGRRATRALGLACPLDRCLLRHGIPPTAGEATEVPEYVAALLSHALQ